MTPSAIADCIEPISALGFTELEAAAYAYLVQHSPATGYRIAHGIGKPIANTYKAIESLARKGAVVVEQTSSRLCRAVPPDEVLERAEHSFRKRHNAATRALSLLPLAGQDAGVYGLTSRDQVFDRARRLLSQARGAVLLDLFPEPYAELEADIKAAAARGLAIGVQVYEPAVLDGVETVVKASGAAVQRKWPGQWLNLVADGAELVMAFLGEDGHTVHQAIWSQSPFLCWAYQSALAGELLSSRLERAIDERWPAKRVRDTITRFAKFRAHESVRYQDLAARRRRASHRTAPAAARASRKRP
ncbi:MAG: helix-turn-helix domain-containing protein [Gemmatimonadota bacterium]